MYLQGAEQLQVRTAFQHIEAIRCLLSVVCFGKYQRRSGRRFAPAGRVVSGAFDRNPSLLRETADMVGQAMGFGYPGYYCVAGVSEKRNRHFIAPKNTSRIPACLSESSADGQYGKDDSILSISRIYHGYRYELQSFFENLLKTDGYAFSLLFKMAPHFVRNNSVEVNQKKIVQSNDAFPWKGIAVLHPR